MPGRRLTAAIAGTGVYGGYFGAAQSDLLLAVPGVLDDTDPRRANGVKNLLTFVANTAVALVFILSDRAVWSVALANAVGGYIGGHSARRLPQWLYRVAIITVGILATASLLNPR